MTMPPSQQAVLLVLAFLAASHLLIPGVQGWRGGTLTRSGLNRQSNGDRCHTEYEQQVCWRTARALHRPTECALRGEGFRGGNGGREAGGLRILASTAKSSVESGLQERWGVDEAGVILATMNRLPEDVLAYVMAYTPLGTTAKKKNALTAGSYVVEKAEVKGLDGAGMDVEVTIRTRTFFGQMAEKREQVRVPFGTGELRSGEAVKRRLMEMSREQGKPRSTATIYKIPVGSYGGLPFNLLLNNVPHSKLARNFIYQSAAEAVVMAVQDPGVPRRMKLVCTVPELNVAMDTYRVGTMLEMIREIAYSLADVGLNTRIMVQPSMGEGIFKSLPLALSGVMSILKGMDWEEGLIGDHIRFGELGEEKDVSPEDDVFVAISPQSVAGFTIHDRLVAAVEQAAGRPFIIVNPNLKDRPSSGGVMQVRGRGDRMSFAGSFKDVFNFRLLYASSVGFFPIKVPPGLFDRRPIDEEVVRALGSLAIRAPRHPVPSLFRRCFVGVLSVRDRVFGFMADASETTNTLGKSNPTTRLAWN